MHATLKRLGLAETVPGAASGAWQGGKGEVLASVSPGNGKVVGRVHSCAPTDLEKVLTNATTAFESWRRVPAPRRGDIVRQIGNALRQRKADLGALVSLETGKIRAEGEGEVQEMIDMADMAVGQSRMLYGRTLPSERPGHRLFEQWHPLGPVGVITAFNFPVAVWSWNAFLAMVAGDPVIWKPSHKAPLCAWAVLGIAWQVLAANGLPEGILSLAVGDRRSVGEPLIRDPRVALISATGSVAMGRHVGKVVGQRLGRTILELGGNNAVVVTPSADLKLAVQAILFGAVGTAGQRCTSTRRVIVHKEVYPSLVVQLRRAYAQVTIGDPLDSATLMGPLIDREAVAAMQAALERLKTQGGRVLWGGEVLSGGIYDTGTYVRPCLCEARADMPIVRQETFAPILYLIPYETLEQAITYQNAVPQGLSSAIFTRDFREAEIFLGAQGSDCGIANVNLGTSGAEIGGAFGGEKDTGGGREAGSDAWKAYMRRQTCTLNWSSELPLAQGIRFGVDEPA